MQTPLAQAAAADPTRLRLGGDSGESVEQVGKGRPCGVVQVKEQRQSR